MAKRRDTQTLDLFRDYEPPEVRLDPEITRGGTLDVKIARAISHAMRESDKSRDRIACEMSDYLGGQNVTLNMLDCYASPARRDHKITLERFIALVEVLGCHNLLGFVADFSDYIVVPARYGEIIHLWETEEALAQLENRRAALAGSVKGWRR